MTKLYRALGRGIMAISIIMIAGAVAFYMYFLWWIANPGGEYQTGLKEAAVKRQEEIAKLPPEKRMAYELTRKYNVDYIKDIVAAMNAINSGQQSQAVITGTLDNDILSFLEANGFEVTNTYSTTSGYKYVASRTHYVIQKKSQGVKDDTWQEGTGK